MSASFDRILTRCGQSGALISSLDWSRHSLGPIETWPESLKCTLSLCLGSKTPMLVWWGPQLIEFYNDACLPVLGASKHPRAMGARGADIWPEIWHILQPILDSVLAGGPAVEHQNMLMFLERNGLREETYFNHAHAPIYGADGAVAGVFTTVYETTSRVLSERRLRTLKALAENGSGERDAETACADVAAVLHRNRADIPYCLIYRGAPSPLSLSASAGVEPSALSENGLDRHALERAIASDSALLTPSSLVPTPSPPLEGREAPSQAYLIPVKQPATDSSQTVLVAGLSPHLVLDEAYSDFLALAANQLGRALASARAHADRDAQLRALSSDFTAQVQLRRDIEALSRERERLLTQEQRTRVSVEAASRVKDEFLAVLGHELRNPLAPIATALALMRQRGPLDREVVIIERQVGHLTRLVEDLLDVSRITRGKVELKRKPLNLANVAREAVELASPLLEERQQHLTLDVPGSGLDVLGDRTRLAQVLANLLTNASKYSDRGSHIAVRGRVLSAEDAVELSVHDDGIGIDPRMLKNVWNAFTQGAQAIDRSHGGLGLGLTIVSSLVSLHGGIVTAHSDGIGHGSEFRVRLPLLHTETSHVPEPAQRPSQLRGGVFSGRKVLLVDDNEDAVELLAEWFRARGANVETASDGLAALDAAGRFDPEVALLDLGLPALSGYEVARRLRAQPAHGDMLLVAVTGYGEQSAREQTVAAGFDEHCVKPLDLHKFESLLRDRLSERSA